MRPRSRPKDREGSPLSGRRLGYPYALFAACVFLLLTCGCQNHEKADGYSKRSTQTAKAIEAHGDASKGACSKSDRADYIHENNKKFTGQLRDCSKETWAKKDKNMACLAKVMPSLSKECVGCFVDTASCAAANC